MMHRFAVSITDCHRALRVVRVEAAKRITALAVVAQAHPNATVVTVAEIEEGAE